MTAAAGILDRRVPGYLGRVLDGDGAPVGTCFQVAPGILVTAYHVLDDIGAAAEDARVQVDPLAGGEAFEAVVARMDPVRDLAVLSCDARLPEVTGPLAATDQIPLGVTVTVTGHAVPDDPGHTYRFLNAAGEWAGGTTRDDAVPLGRMTSSAVVPGMSGGPVIRDSDDAVAGVVSGRYNSTDGWLAGTVWVARTEDLAKLLHGIAEVTMRWARNDAGGLPVGVPLGRLPAEIRGRDALRAELRAPLPRVSRTISPAARRSPQPGRVWVLTGMGGLGKSTMALAAAKDARSRGWRVWWVTATDRISLIGGMLEILRQLNAPEEVTRPVSEGVPTAADRAWEFLNGSHLAGWQWLLIFDNADDPAVLAAPGAASPGDHVGWLRPDPRGALIVTTRHRDPRAWGHGIAVRELQPLGEDAAAKVLADLAPKICDPDGRQARELGRRLARRLALGAARGRVLPGIRVRPMAHFRRLSCRTA